MFFLTTPTRFANVLLKVMSSLGFVSSEEIEYHKAAYNSLQTKRLLLSAGFDEGKINTGHFEFFLNIWASATK